VPPFLQRSLFPLKPAGAAQPAADEAPFRALTDAQKQQTVACYASTGVDIDARVVDITRVTTDPQDPAFYGTCLQKIVARNFGLSGAAPPATAGASTFFVNSVGCVSCAARKLYDQYPTLLPQWTASADNCVQCDIEPAVLPGNKAAQVKDQLSFLPDDKAPLSAAQLPWTRVAARDGLACDPLANTCGTGGAANANACVVKLGLLGAPTDTISPEECMRMAQRRGFPDASYDAAAKSCFAYKTDACCNTCKTVAATGLQTFKVPAAPALVSALDYTDMLPELQRAADPNMGPAPTVQPTLRPDPTNPGSSTGTTGNAPTSGPDVGLVAGASITLIALVALVAHLRRNRIAAVGSFSHDAKYGSAVMAPSGQQQAYNPHQSSHNPRFQQQQQQQQW
jgi:hypothetical protein